MNARFDFECRQCGHRETDIVIDTSDGAVNEYVPVICRECGGEMRKVFDGDGCHFRLNGDGFHGSEYGGPMSR